MFAADVAIKSQVADAMAALMAAAEGETLGEAEGGEAAPPPGDAEAVRNQLQALLATWQLSPGMDEGRLDAIEAEAKEEISATPTY